MLNSMMENENTSFADVSVPFLRSCSQQILAKYFSFSIIVFNTMKLLVIIFITSVRKIGIPETRTPFHNLEK